jgi:hypothetical protein
MPVLDATLSVANGVCRKSVETLANLGLWRWGQVVCSLVGRAGRDCGQGCKVVRGLVK